MKGSDVLEGGSVNIQRMRIDANRLIRQFERDRVSPDLKGYKSEWMQGVIFGMKMMLDLVNRHMRVEVDWRSRRATEREGSDGN